MVAKEKFSFLSRLIACLNANSSEAQNSAEISSELFAVVGFGVLDLDRFANSDTRYTASDPKLRYVPQRYRLCSRINHYRNTGQRMAIIVLNTCYAKLGYTHRPVMQTSRPRFWSRGASRTNSKVFILVFVLNKKSRVFVLAKKILVLILRTSRLPASNYYLIFREQFIIILFTKIKC